MPPDPQSPLRPEPAVTAARFDRGGEIAYNLALRILGSPGAAWYASVEAFAAVAERVPPDAPAGTDDRDLLLMGCWHARQMLSRLQAAPDYAAQLQAHDAAHPVRVAAPAVARANEQLPVDQRELLALWGVSGLSHADLAALLGTDVQVLESMAAQARQMLHDALPAADRSEDADAAGAAYRDWARAPVPTGLREAVLAAVSASAPEAPAAPPATADGPAAPRGGGASPRSTDPHATVEWSSGEVAALGLGGGLTDVPTGPQAPIDDDEEWEEPWDEDAASSGDRLLPVDRGRRAPRWQIGLVVVLLIAVVVALVLALTSSDEPTPESPPPATTTTSKAAVGGLAPAGASVVAIRLPQATIWMAL